ncbi:unnamed protein product [Paramecium pentaurelia]|uniref:Protein kinase domain-containing protein n=1 Tax=Paramecium pentaurelia TaxID=43138 RepID=A0A8S1VRZ9_9CILI|nr:unnamed protein product [Paramecium pentaurelia]
MDDNLIGDYVVLMDQKLGQGAFGEAYKCYKRGNSDVEYCIKIIKKSIPANPQKEEKQKKQLQAEIHTFKQLKDQDCENLVKMIDIIDLSSRLCIIMELCEYDLEKELLQFKKDNKWPSRLEIMDMMKQILKGADALIRNHIIHRDIKPQNILVQIVNKGTSNQRKIYKIADFGFTKYIEDIYTKANLTRVGTRSYCAPEIMKGKKFSCKCDIYSYGVVFHQIVYFMDFPKDYKTEIQLNQYFNQIQITPYKCKPLNGEYGNLITNLIEKMLIYDQDERISFEELRTHEIVTFTKRLQDSIFLPIQRTFNQEDYKQEMIKNEEQKFQRLNLLIEIFYRKFLLCKYFVDFMKQITNMNNIEYLIFQLIIQLIGCQQILYGFAMINCIISDLEPTIVNDNDVPQLIDLLNQFMKKSQENNDYMKLQKQLTNDFYQSKITYQQDLNKLYQLRVEKNWTQNQPQFQLLYKSKTQKIPIQNCCLVLQDLTNNSRNINDLVSKCDKKIQQFLQTIKQIDTQFDIVDYRIINPDDIFKI